MKDSLIEKYEPVIDLYKEHLLHEYEHEDCSECDKANTCVICHRIISNGRFCSSECEKEEDDNWAYDRSIGN